MRVPAGTTLGRDSDTVDDWVGCLIMTIGPGADMTWIAEAVEHAEEAVLADPVFGETARIASLTGADLDRDLDDIADLVGRELREWALNPSRNPADRVAFGLLVVHPDRAEADALVSGLSAAQALARLPVVVLAGAPEPAVPAEEPDPARDPHTEVVRMILDAVTSVAQEAEKVPGLVVDVASLDTEPDEHAGVAYRPAGCRRPPGPAMGVPRGVEVTP
jgi:hypothetical protein